MSRKRRLLGVVGAVFMSLAVATAWHLGRAVYYQSQLDRVIAEYRQRGERLLPEDFKQSRLESDDNAAVFLRVAARSIELDDEQRAFLSDFDPALPLDERDVLMVRAIVAHNDKAFAKLSEACARNDADWGLTPGSFSGRVEDLPHLVQMRELTRLLQAKAMLAFHEGDHDAAVDQCAAIWFVHEMTHRQGSIIPRLVAVGISATSLATLEQMAASLNIADGTELPGVRAARREQVEHVIRLLLDDQQPLDAINRAWDAERAQTLAMARHFAATSITSRIMFNRGAIRLLAACDAARQSSVAPTFSAAREALRSIPEADAALASDQWVQILVPSLKRIHVTEFRVRTERRLCATALAVRLYRLDHDGKLPASLSELVPKYLPAVPVDPYRCPPAPLNYAPGPEPRLYSVGENGADDHGASGPARPIDWSAPDYVLFFAP